ncbi:MAG: glycosyltransferase family 2 protein [Lentisphaeria bacterium]|nr:glycosyltransferase family 2 protein [Lentisphaeria bacterium]
MDDDARVLVIVPAYNEEAALEATVSSVMDFPLFDVLIVDDGSRDGTKALALDLSRAMPRVRCVSLPINSGIGTAVQTGFIYARHHGYAYAAQFDGDGQHDANSLHDLASHAIAEKLDLCVGSRFLDLSTENFRSTPLRRLGISFFAWLISVLTGKRVSDPTSGLRIYGHRAIEMFACHYPDDYPEPEALFWCVRNGLRVEEKPAIMHARAGGQSSIRHLKTAYYMIKVTAAICFDRLRAREVCR